MTKRELIEHTLAAIREARRALELEQDRVVEEIGEKDALIQAWVAELDSMDHADEDGPRKKNPRLPKGEPLRKINAFFDGDQKAQSDGATTKEIADTTGLPWSTVRNVLEKPKNGFAKSDNDRWKRVQPAKLRPVQAA